MAQLEALIIWVLSDKSGDYLFSFLFCRCGPGVTIQEESPYIPTKCPSFGGSAALHWRDWQLSQHTWCSANLCTNGVMTPLVLRLCWKTDSQSLQSCYCSICFCREWSSPFSFNTIFQKPGFQVISATVPSTWPALQMLRHQHFVFSMWHPRQSGKKSPNTQTLLQPKPTF